MDGMIIRQVEALVQSGYKVVVPDLLGYGQSEKPSDPEPYQLSRIIDTIVEFLDSIGCGKVHVVGHDWGAAVAWLMAFTKPERIHKLVVLSVGHPGELEAALRLLT